MNLASILLLGILFILSFALSLKLSTKGIKLFFSIAATAIITILIFLNFLQILELVDPLLLLVFLILGIVAVLILGTKRFRLY